MEHLVVHADMPSSASIVWRILTDWARQSEWMLATTVRPVGAQRRAEGDRIEAFTGIGRLGFPDRMVVERWDEGRSVTVAHVGAVVRGTGAFAVEPVGPDASRVIWREDLEVPGGRAGQWAWRVIEPLNRWAVQYSLGRLAKIAAAESGQWLGQNDNSSSTTISGARSGIQ